MAQGMYNPKHGRWLQRDPAGYVDGMNLYVYVRCLPTGNQDPTGLIPVDTALDLGFLLWDMATGANPATIALDVAAVYVPYVPNPRAVMAGVRIINGIKREVSLVKSAKLTRVIEIDDGIKGMQELRKAYEAKVAAYAKKIDPLDEGRIEALRRTQYDMTMKHASLKLQYKGKTPYRVEGSAADTTYPRHFQFEKHFGKGEVSVWNKGTEDREVMSWINAALEFYKYVHPLPSIHTLDGFVFNVRNLVRPQYGAKGQVTGFKHMLGAKRNVGFTQHGRCTDTIKLKVSNNDGSIHAHPWYPKDPF
jgi:hypothetical protein